MAIVDINTGKIYGCKKNSMVWKHEIGHLAFNNTYFGVKINYYQSFFLMLAVFFTSISLLIDNLYLKVISFVLALGVIVCYILEEAWCWGYAFNPTKINKTPNIKSNKETTTQ